MCFQAELSYHGVEIIPPVLCVVEGGGGGHVYGLFYFRITNRYNFLDLDLIESNLKTNTDKSHVCTRLTRRLGYADVYRTSVVSYTFAEERTTIAHPLTAFYHSVSRLRIYSNTLTMNPFSNPKP